MFITYKPVAYCFASTPATVAFVFTDFVFAISSKVCDSFVKSNVTMLSLTINAEGDCHLSVGIFGSP